MAIKDPTTPQSCRFTTVCNISIQHLHVPILLLILLLFFWFGSPPQKNEVSIILNRIGMKFGGIFFKYVGIN